MQNPQSTQPTFYAKRRTLLQKDREYVVLKEDRTFSKERGQLTHCASYGGYQVYIHEYTKLQFEYSQNAAPIEFTFPAKVEVLSAAPIPGYFAVELMDYRLYIIRANGIIEPIASNKLCDFTLTSFHWISLKDRLILLVGGGFGDLMCYTITPTDIQAMLLYSSPERLPISSIASIRTEFLLVGTTRGMIFCNWNPMVPVLTKKTPIQPLNAFDGNIPTFVATNEEYIAWLTLNELRVYQVNELWQGQFGTSSISFAELAKILRIDPMKFFGQTIMPLSISKHHVIITSEHVILGLNIHDCSIAFQFPLEASIMAARFDSFSETMQIFTPRAAYSIDLSNVSARNEMPSVTELRADAIETFASNKYADVNDMLISLLDDSNYARAVDLLKAILENEYKKVQILSLDNTITPEKQLQIILQFMIFEFQILDACKLEAPSPTFEPLFEVDTNKKYDLFEMLYYLISLRAAEPKVYSIIQNKEFLKHVPPSKRALRLLINAGAFDTAVEAILAGNVELCDILFSAVMNQPTSLRPFYNRTDDKSIQKLLLTMFPLVGHDMPIASLLALLKGTIAAKYARETQLIFIALALRPHDSTLDNALYDLLKTVEHPITLSNPFCVIEYLSTNSYHRSAAMVAFSTKYYLQAAQIARGISENFAIHFIKRSPHSLRHSLYGAVGIDERLADEDTPTFTKEKLADELQLYTEKLEHLSKQAEDSSRFLEEIKSWGGEVADPDPICPCCRQKVTKGYTFPCGHCYHKQCLIDNLGLILPPAQHQNLVNLCSLSSPTIVQTQEIDSLLLSDCPTCGMCSASTVGCYLYDSNWPSRWPDQLSGLTMKRSASSQFYLFSRKNFLSGQDHGAFSSLFQH